MNKIFPPHTSKSPNLINYYQQLRKCKTTGIPHKMSKGTAKRWRKIYRFKICIKTRWQIWFSLPSETRLFCGKSYRVTRIYRKLLDQCLFKSYIYGQYWNVALIRHSRDSDTKRSMHATGCSVIFYATAFKTLKREFRDRFLISYLKLKNLFCQLQIKDNNRTSLWQFHH